MNTDRKHPFEELVEAERQKDEEWEAMLQLIRQEQEAMAAELHRRLGLGDDVEVAVE